MLRLFTYTQTFAATTWYALRDREEGQTMAEYGVVLAVITLLVIGVLTALSTAIQTKIGNVVTALGG